MTVIPLLVSLLLVGITSSGTRTVASVGGRSLGWFIGLAGASAILGGVLAPPILRLIGTSGIQLPEVAGGAAATDVTLPPFRDWFVGLLPSNPVAAAADGAILPLVLFTVVFALAATHLAAEHRDRITAAADSIAKTVFVIVEWILAVAPIGVFALSLNLGARTGASIVGAVAGYIIATALLVLIATAALYPLVGLLSRTSIRRFAKACAPVQAVGFSTRSSLASLPVMIEAAEGELHLPASASGLALPAAVAVFKFASPIVRLTGTLFIASLYGIDLGLWEMVSLMAGIAALSFYSPGIPSGALFVMAPLFQAFGLPIEGIGILIALDIVPDMFITMSNVTADLAVATIVSEGTGG